MRPGPFVRLPAVGLSGLGLPLALEEAGDLGQPAVGVLPGAQVAVEPDARVRVDAVVQPVATGQPADVLHHPLEALLELVEPLADLGDLGGEVDAVGGRVGAHRLRLGDLRGHGRLGLADLRRLGLRGATPRGRLGRGGGRLPDRLPGETGLAADRIRYLLRNPLFNGWMRRHRGPDELRKPAPWRTQPPVSDALWAQVEKVRRGKTRGGGPRNRGRVDLLAGLLECVCGRRLRSDGAFADGQHRKLHPDPCDAWGRRARLPDVTWEAPILAQVSGMRLDDAVLAEVIDALGVSGQPTSLDRARLERQMRDLALEHVAERIGDEGYLARLGQMRAALAELDAVPHRDVPAERVVEWVRALADTWQRADVPEAKAELLHAIYERIVVVGRRFVGARLTPAAYDHGLAVLLPEVVMARPAGFEPAT